MTLQWMGCTLWFVLNSTGTPSNILGMHSREHTQGHPRTSNIYYIMGII